MPTPLISTSARWAKWPHSQRALAERRWFRIICRIPPSTGRAMAKQVCRELGKCSANARWDSTDDSKSLSTIARRALVGISGVVTLQSTLQISGNYENLKLPWLAASGSCPLSNKHYLVVIIIRHICITNRLCFWHDWTLKNWPILCAIIFFQNIATGSMFLSRI